MKNHLAIPKSVECDTSAINSDVYAKSFISDGYFVRDSILSELDVAKLRESIDMIPDGDEKRKRRGVYGVRNLLHICSDVRQLARDPRIRQFVCPVLGDEAFAVRAIFFNKVEGANWSLFWHQDSVIAVKQRVETDGFVGWSCKAGVWQVQPPPDILSKMVAVRVHLDDCHAKNGPLRVLPGSHRSGWLDDEIDSWKATCDEVVCTVDSGGIVSMCPMTLHASSAAEKATHRRVIHIEYAAEELPGSLDWNNRI